MCRECLRCANRPGIPTRGRGTVSGRWRKGLKVAIGPADACGQALRQRIGARLRAERPSSRICASFCGCSHGPQGPPQQWTGSGTSEAGSATGRKGSVHDDPQSEFWGRWRRGRGERVGVMSCRGGRRGSGLGARCFGVCSAWMGLRARSVGRGWRCVRWCFLR